MFNSEKLYLQIHLCHCQMHAAEGLTETPNLYEQIALTVLHDWKTSYSKESNTGGTANPDQASNSSPNRSMPCAKNS